MKIQELAIIFIIIILPISLLLSEYTQFQIQTLKMQTEYDAKLTDATYDAIKAFQLNTTNSTTSDLANSKMRDLEASVVAFRNSIMSAFKLNGYTENDLNNYIPALVYTLYDGFYIYSPYNNKNYRYETDDEGNIIKDPATNAPIGIDENGEDLYGLKPYISYSCRYKYPPNASNPSIDVIISYALDNYITVQGIIEGEYVNRSGYLIDNIIYTPGEDTDGDGVEDTYTIKYNNVEIKEERLLEDLGGNVLPYFKNNGTKYYLLGNQIVYVSNGTITVQFDETRDPFMFAHWKKMILNNNYAKQYYKEAYEFSYWFKETVDLDDVLIYGCAYDEVINEDGTTTITKLWDDTTNEYTKKIFDFNSSASDFSKNIENELSNFNQHRLSIIRHKIETNLAIAISNYNTYSGVTSNVFQMPELKEDEWDNITNNISLISFLQGLPIGGKIYNGYTLVTNSESKEVVLEENIYILGDDYAYHRIGDNEFENGGTLNVATGVYGDKISAGRLNLDFERATLINKNNIQTYYYYPLTQYNASYNSIVMQNDVTTYDDIYKYVNEQDDDDIRVAFYTALGRERSGKFNSNVIIDTGTIRPGGASGTIPGGPGIPSIPDPPEEPEEPDTFTVTFNPNGGIGGPSQITDIPAGTVITIPNPIPSREGYEFAYWSTAYGITYNKGSTYTVTGNITFTAVWDKILATYIVAYEPNGGANEPLDQVKIEGINLRLSSSIPTRSGHIFLGWSTSPTGSVEYDPGDTYTQDAPLTLYAIWEKVLESYTITYNANGGTGAPATQTKTEGINLTLSPTKPTRVGYEFKGWATSETGVVQYQAGGTYSADANVTLYAIWEPIMYTITYNANGGSVTPTSQQVAAGSTITLPTPTRGGYNFKGWTASGTTYNAGTSYTVNGNVTFVANWDVVKYTVTYDANGGNVTPTSQQVDAGSTITLPTPTRGGYNFKGWTASGTTYNAGTSYTVNGNVTFVANWDVVKYTVTYDANGGSITPTSQQVDAGSTITLPTPTRGGYEFTGWSLSGTTYNAGTSYTVNGNVTFVANWDVVKYTVTYDANGGNVTPTSQQVNAGSTVTLPTPTRDGYEFTGWSLSGTTYNAGASYQVNGNVTFVANWNRILATYTITYDANGGSGGPGSQTVTEGETATIPSTIPTKTKKSFFREENIKFLGWKDNNNKIYQPGDSITPTASITLYAIWEDANETYTITYNANGGSGGPSEQVVIRGESAIIPDEIPTRVMFGRTYTFKGWSKSKYSTATLYQPGETITPTSNMPLYAIWERN